MILSLLKRSYERFDEYRGRDNAAMLSFFTILSLAPSFLTAFALARLLMVNHQEAAVSVMETAIKNYLPEKFQGDAQQLAQSMWDAAGWGLPGLLLSTVLALWSASTYVRGFTRVANDLNETEESRGLLRRWAVQVLLTLVILASMSITLVTLTANPEVMGLLGEGFQGVWSIMRWPLILVITIILVTLLYRISPDIKHDPKQGVSIGGVVAVVGSLIVWGLLALYIRFFNVEGLYGVSGYFMALCFAMWAVNIMMVFGLAVDVERKRRGRDY